MLIYKTKNEFVKENSSSNVVLSAMTTAYARVHLYKYMETIHDTPEAILLYTDTDSVVFAYKGDCPLKNEKILGGMAKENADKEMVLWKCGGPKQYVEGYLNSEGQLERKGCIRGFNFDNTPHLLDQIEGIMLNPPVFNPNCESVGVKQKTQFRIDMQRLRMHQSEPLKEYAPVCQKGMIDSNGYMEFYGG